MKTLLTAILALSLISCAAIDNLFDEGTTRSDAVQTRATVKVMPYDQLMQICAKWPAAVACTMGGTMYIQGEEQSTTMLLTVQYLSWADIGDQCGRITGTPSCYENGTLYTHSAYNFADRYGAPWPLA